MAIFRLLARSATRGLRRALLGRSRLNIFRHGGRPPWARGFDDDFNIQIPQLSAKIVGADRVVRWLDNQHKHAEKSLNVSIKKETYRLSQKLKKEIKQGSPGGKRLQELTSLSKLAPLRKQYNKKPLSRLAAGVRYEFSQTPQFTGKVGFIGGPARFHDLFRKRAIQHHEGFMRRITDRQRDFFINRGASLGTIEGGDTPFFLRRRTTAFNTPSRPIITNFWRANKIQAQKNIKRNFKLKMAGKRI